MVLRTLPPKDPKLVLEQFLEIAATGDDLIAAANEPVDWVWKPYVASGSICLIGGNTTGGKTTFIFLLLAGRLADRPIDFLDHPLAPAHRDQYVVIIEPEHSRGSASRKLKKSARLLGLDYEKISKRLLVVSGSNALIVGDARWRQLCQLVAAGMVSDILLDTIASTTKEKANEEQDQIVLFGKLRLSIESAPAERPPPVVWVLAHKRKGKNDDNDDEIDVAAVSGSLQRAAQSNTILMIRSNRRDHRITSATCFFLKTKEEPLEGFKDTDHIPKTFVVTHDRFQLLGKKTEVKPLPIRILELLSQVPEGMTLKAISERLTRSRGDVKTALSGLVAEKKVRRGDDGGDESEIGELFFIVSSAKSKTKQEGGTKTTKTGKKGGGDDGGDEGGTKTSVRGQVVDMSKYRRGGDEK